MKKLSRIVTLFLALALVFSVSAVALAQNVPGTDGTNECTVKINTAINPFAEWTFPSEIIITVAPKDNSLEATIDNYNIVVSDALIFSNQKLVFGFIETVNLEQECTVTFTNSPLDDATFRVGTQLNDNEANPESSSDGYIETRFESGNWTIPVTLLSYNPNNSWSGVEGHIILNGTSDVFEANNKLNFEVVFETIVG